MTATLLPPDARHDVLLQRLEALRLERDRTVAEVIPSGAGDAADRATNVDGQVRLAMLEDRIANLESELSEGRRPERAGADVVAEGDVVDVDFGDGPESFFLGSIDHAGDGVDVITPGSPLGRALVGATVGVTVSYSARTGRTLQATVVAIR